MINYYAINKYPQKVRKPALKGHFLHNPNQSRINKLDKLHNNFPLFKKGPIPSIKSKSNKHNPKKSIKHF